ncbi:hypothetical protein L3Q82_020997 [Scortum barcoo]|uniref:Uncharacterized protein n=1 Tax=Scortum barcoo TaxID=214431 RepID=A0ACB8V963_9TELE|nr:hypothetical protein L3Q82_020997 [Scortum barcoo]
MESPVRSTIKYPSQGLQEGRVLCTAVRPVGTNNSKRPIPNPKAQGSDPLVHRGELQHVAAELGSYEQAHTSSPPLTLGNSRVVEGPAPLKELGSRAQAMRGGSLPRLLPKPHCTGPSWTFLRVVSLLEGGPTSPFRAEPGRVPWAKTRPPGARLRAPTPGLAPGMQLTRTHSVKIPVRICCVDEGSPQLNPSRVATVMEGNVVTDELASLPQAFCVISGLIYALHLEYPKYLKNTFYFVQQVMLNLGKKSNHSSLNLIATPRPPLGIIGRLLCPASPVFHRQHHISSLSSASPAFRRPPAPPPLSQLCQPGIPPPASPPPSRPCQPGVPPPASPQRLSAALGPF